MSDIPKPARDTLPPEIRFLILENLPDLYSLQSAIESRVMGDISAHRLRQLKSSIFQSEMLDYENNRRRQGGKIFRELLIADREEFELAWPAFKEGKSEELLIPAAIHSARRYVESDRTDCAIDLLKRIWDKAPPFGWSTIPDGRTGGSALRFARARAERRRLERVPTLFPLGKYLLSLLTEDQEFRESVQRGLESISTLVNTNPAFASLPLALIDGNTISIYRPKHYEHAESLLASGMFRYELPSANHSEGYRWYNEPIVVGISNRFSGKQSDDLQILLDQRGLPAAARDSITHPI